MIDPTQSDVGRSVTYIPGHARGDITHPDCERGVIRSFNKTCVFVQYKLGGNGIATSREDLVWS